jgi:hypothetical protein
MKIMIFNEVYNGHTNQLNPCRECILSKDRICSKIPSALCIECGGFQSSDTKIFTL